MVQRLAGSTYWLTDKWFLKRIVWPDKLVQACRVNRLFEPVFVLPIGSTTYLARQACTNLPKLVQSCRVRYCLNHPEPSWFNKLLTRQACTSWPVQQCVWTKLFFKYVLTPKPRASLPAGLLNPETSGPKRFEPAGFNKLLTRQSVEACRVKTVFEPRGCPPIC